MTRIGWPPRLRGASTVARKTGRTMTSDWQNVATIGLVLAALAYLLRRTWLILARKKSAGCGSCAACPADSVDKQEPASANGKPLVSIEALVKTAHKD